MTSAELWGAWRLWMVVAAAIIVVAAILLVVIWRAARGIHAEAVRALAAAERIRANTMPIWALQATNEVAAGMLGTVRHIEETGGTLARALESHAGAH
jgi:hypothetical protein